MHEDVQLLIPKLIKTLCLCNINYKIHYIDMKNLPINMGANQNIIDKVPTVIFKENERERFRISEKILHSIYVEKEIEYILTSKVTISESAFELY